MEEKQEQKELTAQELAELVRRQAAAGGEFIIQVRPGGEGADADTDAGAGSL